jgi:hypothetical protein
VLRALIRLAGAFLGAPRLALDWDVPQGVDGSAPDADGRERAEHLERSRPRRRPSGRGGPDGRPRGAERPGAALPESASPQLALDLATRPRTADELLARLHELGLEGITRCRLTRNRTVMVSYRGGELRIHEGYLAAPAPVLQAVVAFVCGRTRAQRRAAQRLIVGYKIERPEGARPDGRRRARERTRPEDASLARALAEAHAYLNALHFDGALRDVPIRVSRRLKTRLGHYTAALPTGDTPEIVIGHRHVRRHGWDEAVHTLLHEMVHQWQDETGQAVDHGATFRAKAREVGITPAARRTVSPRPLRAEPESHAVGLRAARES